MGKENRPTPREELYLVWLFLQNTSRIRRSRTRFNRMFGMQKRVRHLLGWGFEEVEAEEMMAFIEKEVERLKERFAFDAEYFAEGKDRDPMELADVEDQYR